jgi:hypothetical protein
MNEENIILLHEGDVWLSNSSLHLLGIFTTQESLNVYLGDMLSSGIIDQYGYDCLSGKIPTARGQVQMDNSAFMIEYVEVNPTKYDN